MSLISYIARVECSYRTPAAERAQEKSPMRYLLTKELMIENGYPMPSYLAETFEKPAGWVETKVAAADDLLSTTPAGEVPRIYAMDCEMVRYCLHHPFW